MHSQTILLRFDGSHLRIFSRLADVLRRSAVKAGLAVLLALLFAPHGAAAQTFGVTGDWVAIEPDQLSAFSFTSDSVQMGAGYTSGIMPSFHGGDQVNLSRTESVGGSFARGTAAINGQNFSPVWFHGAMAFNADPFTAPPGDDPRSAKLHTTFTMSAHLQGYDNASYSGTPLFDVTLTGHGVLYALYQVVRDGDQWLYVGGPHASAEFRLQRVPNYTVTDLGTDTFQNSQAFGVNSSGQVAGQLWTLDPGDTLRADAALWTPGTFQDLGTVPPRSLAAALGINDP